MTIVQFWRGWRKFWFEPQYATPMALFRIAFGTLAFLSAVIFTLPDLQMWLGENAINKIQTVQRFYGNNQAQIDLLMFLPPGDNALYAYFYCYIAATVLLAFGLFTPYAAWFVALSLLSFENHQPYNMNGGDAMLRFASVFVALSHCGEAISLDRLIKRFRRFPLPAVKFNPWAQRMLQAQVAIAYGDTFCCKISGAQWLEGTAVYYATRLDDMFKIPIPFLMNNLICCKLLTWFTLVIEGALFTLIWFRDLRYWVLLGGLCLHLGIDTTINLPIFEWVFMASFLTFIYPEDLTKVADKIKQLCTIKFGKSAPLLINENLVYQLQLASIIDSLDFFGRVKQQHQVGQLNIEIETAKGRLSGFVLFSWLCGRLPLLWVLIPFVRIFGLSAISKVLFEALAKAWLSSNKDVPAMEQVSVQN